MDARVQTASSSMAGQRAALVTEEVNRDNDQGSLWANITAVVSVACMIGALYLPFILRSAH
jgi:hypothetical protein